MKILVSIKQVPDTTNIRINPETGTLVREGVPSIVNPYDVHALALASELKRRHGGHLTVITMGPPQAAEALREAVEYGADRVILLSDRKFAGADTLATSYTLAETIKYLAQEEPFDLFLFGKQAIDGDTAQVGPGVACRLGVPLITYAVKVEVFPEEKKIRVHRKTERGLEVLEAPLPVLVTCDREVAEPPFSPLSALIQAVKTEPEVFTASGPVSFVREKLGLKGSPTRVHRVFTPELKSPGERIFVSEVGLEEAVSRILNALSEKGVL
ncbi:electron transfer flavoprotein subunit beta/FixA family protein [Thermosulfurimonas marina]|uniref:Electron transfer flavoprotein subunit beta/FixA family protein n=1 Tax=Thermosulfurimonas marina TaxID=2047767 RepID=A0A6H1WQA1_9BACT|nr:electron transfer flavoprotein subunit beta/FixA family protein [Thermosulfurimonas marina]QJA05353.1 electron transfer flavoprotein subunit beta/FixA family protein [Thermosulfurimonas marina]